MPDAYNWSMAGKFILKRLLRIEPPYIVSIIFALLVNFFLISQYKPDWMNVLFHFVYLNNFFDQPYLSPVYWTLGIEFQYYLFVAIFFPFIIKKWGVWALAALCLLPRFIQMPGGLLFSVFSFFVLGILYYLFFKGIKRRFEVVILGVIISFICVFQNGIVETLAGLFAMLLLILPLKNYRIVRFFSKISFSLYLTHDIIGSRLVIYLGRILPHNFTSKAISFTSGLVVSIAFAYLFYKLIEAPFFNLSKNIKYSLRS